MITNFMNVKQSLMILLASALLFSSCQNPENSANQDDKEEATVEQSASANTSSLIGSWEDQSQAALHFTLFADGTAKSDNMSTLLYERWSVNGNELSLVAKSVGNKQSSIDTMVYSIEKLNENEMTLKHGDLILEYKKVNKGNDSVKDQKKKILKSNVIGN